MNVTLAEYTVTFIQYQCMNLSALTQLNNVYWRWMITNNLDIPKKRTPSIY